MKRTVVIDYLPESAHRYPAHYAAVAIDVIRATTTASTAVHVGRRVLPARAPDDALQLAANLVRPLLVGELGGNMCYGFDLTNSPAQIERRTDTDRPMVLVSSSGTQLILNAAERHAAVYISCLRNYSAVARFLAERHTHVAVLGAGTRGQFRREDQIGCALLAEQLLAGGFEAEDQATLDYVEKWREADFDVIREGRSADYLRRSDQEADLEFVLSHIDDIETVPWLVTGEFVDANRQSTAVLEASQTAWSIDAVQ